MLNADDAQLLAQAPGLAARFGRAPPLGWFAADADAAALRAHRAARRRDLRRARRPPAAALRPAREHDLGVVAAMPLTVGGIAAYNVANLAAAALAAAALGIAPAAIAAVFARFGAALADNPGRLMRFERGGVQVLVDYAHNPDGLRGLLRVAEHLRGGAGRLGLLLGHAGNRQDADIEALARDRGGVQPGARRGQGGRGAPARPRSRARCRASSAPRCDALGCRRRRCRCA